jgi:hypothetical protein
MKFRCSSSSHLSSSQMMNSFVQPAMTSKGESEVQTTAVQRIQSPNDVAPSTSDTPSLSDKAQSFSRPRRFLRTFQRYAWDDPDKPKGEKWFLLKLDFFLLMAACLGYFSKNLDQSNVKNAYVSGVRWPGAKISKHANVSADERVIEHARERTDICRQLLHCWVCHRPSASSDACDSGASIDTDPDSGNSLVDHDLLHIIGHERFSAIRYPLFDWTLRERILSSYDCKLHTWLVGQSSANLPVVSHQQLVHQRRARQAC